MSVTRCVALFCTQLESYRKNMEDVEVAATFGCFHYKRKCQLVAPCCGHTYTCRFCHDEKENHSLNRKEVAEVVCLSCATRQKVGNTCMSCNITFGNYFCAICRLYDDEDKKQFHCDDCGICRVGGRDNFVHCVKCDICLPVTKSSHKCVEKASRTNCPVCLEDLHSSRIPSHLPDCGHLIHRTCYEDLFKNGIYTCPLCSVSMLKMKEVWKRLDEEVRSTPMPTEYANWKVGILCRDCHKECIVPFHVIGLKCVHCGSYNTCRTEVKPPSTEVAEDNRDDGAEILEASLSRQTSQDEG